MIKDIAHLALNPLDMGKSVEFFGNVLGWKKAFEIHHENGDPWIVYIKICKGHFLELFYDAQNDKDYAFDIKKTGYHHIGVATGDIHRTLQEICDRGFLDSAEPEVGPDGNLCKWLYDPDGNAIVIREYLPDSVQMGSNEAPYGYGFDGYVGIAHACFVCKDIRATLDFYCNKLGLKLIAARDNAEGVPGLYYVRVKDGVYLELVAGGEGENPNTGWNSRGYQHLCLESDNLLEDVEYLRSIGVEIVQEPKCGSDLNWQAWLKDPDGNKIELMMVDPGSPQAKA